MMVGRELQNTEHKSHVRPEVVLSVENLNRGNAVRNVGFDLHAGEVLGIAGLVGAGRTELVRLLAGVDRATSGTITLKGRRMRFHSPKDAINAGIALLPEDRKKEGIIPLRSICSNVALPRLGRLADFGWLHMGAIRSQVKSLTKIVGLRPPKINSPIKYFSGGNQQKAIICRWIMAKVEVLIFDEPTRGIDVGAKNEIYHLIEGLAAEGRSLIVVSSDLPEILRLSDRVLVIRRGEAAGIINRCDLNETSVMRMAV
jgi:ribose transport system ATP-binding protein